MFILDSGKHCFVWIGRGASHDEKRNGLSRAHVSDSSTSFIICAALNNSAHIRDGSLLFGEGAMECPGKIVFKSIKAQRNCLHRQRLRKKLFVLIIFIPPLVP